jgi:ketosteroid isomerase-like protein
MTECSGDTERAMSRENVEIVRRVINEFTETRQLSLVSPELVWHVGSWSEWPGRPEFHGHDGFREFFAEWTDAYEEWTLEVERITDAGESHVVVAARQRGRLRGSDSWVALRAWLLYTVESGLLVRAEVYATPEEALEAAGLEK